MRQQLACWLIISLVACTDSSDSRHPTPPELKIINYDPLLRKTDDGWFYKNDLFSGYVIEKEKDGRVVYQVPIVDGLENGLAKGWYNSGEKLLERRFTAGKKEGLFKQWWPNGRLRYLFFFNNNQYDGKQFAFFPNGFKREESSYVKGKKEGQQRVWNEKGTLVSNYTVKNGRNYGLISAKSCIPVIN